MKKLIHKIRGNGSKTTLRWRVFIAAVAISLSFPFLFTRSGFLDFNGTGQIGDTIGGIVTPFIAIIAAWLTFEAFKMQYDANVQIREDMNRERFEGKFYELLKIHQANVSEIEINDVVFRRKCFVLMFNELRFVYLVLAEKNEALRQKTISAQRMLEIAYSVYFYGIGSNSEKYYQKQLSSEEGAIVAAAKPVFEQARKTFDGKENTKTSIEFSFDVSTDHGEGIQQTLSMYYYPIDGHSVRLGHYYRHLFKMMNFVVNDEKLTENEKHDFVSIIRAQLSSHEQLLLYYNSSARFAEEWYTFFTRYRLIKNLPLDQADFGPRPSAVFEKEIRESRKEKVYLFEDHERADKQQGAHATL